MAKSKYSTKVILFLLSFVSCALVSANGIQRILSAELNPGCPPQICKDGEENDTQTVIHVKADGPNDSLHYIWDFSRQPSVLVALTKLNTTLTIKWDQFVNDTPNVLEFSTKPNYTMSFILSKIFMFNDVKDRATFVGINPTDIYTINAQDLKWVREHFNQSTSEVQVTIAGNNTELFGEDGTVKLKLKCFGNEDRDTDFPHLLHSINVTQIDMEFVNLTANALKNTNSSFNSTRIAAEFILVAEESGTKPFKILERKTLDDEHTPGIFQLIDITSPEGAKEARGSYVQFRPISYTKPDRDISSGREVHLNGPSNVDNPNERLNTTLAWSYYGNTLDTVLVQVFNVSFGQNQDDFYAHTNYTTWTVVLGYGFAPPEHLSMLVIIIACIGMGVPLLLLIAGGTYLGIKRMRNR